MTGANLAITIYSNMFLKRSFVAVSRVGTVEPHQFPICSVRMD
jgi:hypothetical protein